MQVGNGPANSHAHSQWHHHCCLMLGSRLGTRAKGHNICKSAKPGPADVWETPCGDETMKSRSCLDVCQSHLSEGGQGGWMLHLSITQLWKAMFTRLG